MMVAKLEEFHEPRAYVDEVPCCDDGSEAGGNSQSLGADEGASCDDGGEAGGQFMISSLPGHYTAPILLGFTCSLVDLV